MKDNFETKKWLKQYEGYTIKYERFLYSVVTNVVFGLEDVEFASLSMCVEKILEEDLSNAQFNGIVKLNDHIDLANQQKLASIQQSKIMGNDISIAINGIVGETSVGLTTKFNNEIEKQRSNLEKNNISILGIFASIVVAFTAGITFNASVLANMHNVNIYKLIFVIIMISQGTLHLVHLLMNNLYRISNETKGIYPVWLIWFDIITAVILIGTFAVYQFEYSRFKLWF